MKKIIFLFLILPMLCVAQDANRIEKSLNYKVAMMQNFVKMGEGGELAFWQTKGKITFAIVNYTDAQNPIFKDLFIAQYQELLPIYNKMVVSEDEHDTALFVRTAIRQEDDYRNLLTPEQRVLYSAKLAELEKTDEVLSDSYTALYFSDGLLADFKKAFAYK